MSGFVFGADLGVVSFLESTVLGDVLCGGLVRIFLIVLIVLLGLAFAIIVDFKKVCSLQKQTCLNTKVS